MQWRIYWHPHGHPERACLWPSSLAHPYDDSFPPRSPFATREEAQAMADSWAKITPTHDLFVAPEASVTVLQSVVRDGPVDAPAPTTESDGNDDLQADPPPA